MNNGQLQETAQWQTCLLNGSNKIQFAHQVFSPTLQPQQRSRLFFQEQQEQTTVTVQDLIHRPLSTPLDTNESLYPNNDSSIINNGYKHLQQTAQSHESSHLPGRFFEPLTFKQRPFLSYLLWTLLFLGILALLLIFCSSLYVYSSCK